KIEQEEEDLKEALSNLSKAESAKRKAAGSRQEEEDELNEKTDVSENDFVVATVLEKQIEQRHIIEFGNKTYFSKGNEIQFSIQQQPAFNRQFKLLIENLKSFETKKYNIYLFAENPKQLERLHSIFSDQDAQINFVPIPVSIHEGLLITI